MAKFTVRCSERVFYPAVIIEAEDEEAAEEIVRQMDPSDFGEATEGEDFEVEAEESSPSDFEIFKEVKLKR